jgi:hypothetical protein
MSSHLRDTKPPCRRYDTPLTVHRQAGVRRPQGRKRQSPTRA